jgi:chitodextrinase
MSPFQKSCSRLGCHFGGRQLYWQHCGAGDRHVKFRTPWLRWTAASSVLLLTVVLALAMSQEPATAVPLGMRVVGNQLERDGQPFLPRGFNMIGVLAPDGCTSAPSMALKARASFGARELTAMRDQWSANTVRFQVSQRGLDPQDPIYTPDYLIRIDNAVSLARSLGLTVVLSMQDQSNGCGTVHPLPSDATVRAWQTLAPIYANDPYVMYELFNEPQNHEDAAGWAQWLGGGDGPLTNQGASIVGFQQLVQTVRDEGATNVLLADGARNAERLQGVPPLSDPLPSPQIAYAWHPYYFHLSRTSTLTTDQSNWDSRVAGVLANAPVIVTEWNASATNCTAGTAQRAPDFLHYLQLNNIGLLGHAFDVPNTMVTNLTTWQATSLTGFGCNVAGPDAGQLVQSAFRAQAQNEPAPPDVTPPSSPVLVDATPQSASAVLLRWLPSSDDSGVSGYYVYRDGDQIADVPAGTESYFDGGLSELTGYAYTVAAYDSAGNVSPPSTACEVTTPGPDTVPPSVPQDLSTEAVSATSVDLTWQPSIDDVAVAGYHVYRDGELVATITDGVRYSDNGLTDVSTYTYTVDAFDVSGNISAVSSAVTATTPDGTPPSTPVGLTGIVTQNGSIALSWAASVDNVQVAGYDVSRNGILLAAAPTTTYLDTTETQGVSYTYTVVSYDAAGNASPASSGLKISAPDTSPPTTPTGLKVTPGIKANTLRWNASTDNVAVQGYYVNRGGVRIATVRTGTNVTDKNLVSGKTYRYSVVAFDTAGNRSAASTSVYGKAK